jgi:hypothetical protein
MIVSIFSAERQLHVGFQRTKSGESSPSNQQVARRVERGCSPRKSNEQSEAAQ